MLGIQFTLVEASILAVNLLVLWQLGIGSFVRFVCFQIAVVLGLELYELVGRIDDDWDFKDWAQPALLLAGTLLCLYLAFRSSSRKT